MRKKILIAVAVIAFLGAIIAAVSTFQHIKIMKSGFEEASFCAISEKINCDIVNASSYSEFLGVPVAWFGFIFYILVAVMALFGAVSKQDRRSSVSFAWFMSLASVITSAYYAYIAIAVLGVVCIECVAMYAANISLAVLLFVALKIGIRNIMKFFIGYFKGISGNFAELGFKPRLVPHLAVVVCVFLIGSLCLKSATAKPAKLDQTVSVEEKMRAFDMQSLYSIEPDPNWPVWGNPNAKVTLIEFSEFQCPFCRVAAFSVKSYLQEFKKNVRLYFVNYPLDQSCNKDLDHPMHEWACMAARAGVCAKMKGDFWGFHDDLFRKQKVLSDNIILDIAQKHGWNKDEFKTCMDSPEAAAQVQKDLEAGRKIYVQGTPTLFLDNKKVRYWSDPRFLQEVVKKEVSKH